MKYLPRVCTYTSTRYVMKKKINNKKRVGVRSVEVVSYIFFCDGQWVEKTYGGYLTTNQFCSIADEDVQLDRTHIKQRHDRNDEPLQSIHCEYILIFKIAGTRGLNLT